MTEKFIFREKRKTVKLCCSDIVYFESYGHYITIYLKDKSTHHQVYNICSDRNA